MNFQQKFGIISTILALPILTLSQDSPPLVCNDFGTCYQGSWMEAKSIATFQGIRYAQPPIGELRFKNPIPINQQEGTIDVSEISTVKCTQIGFLSGNVLLGQEDCLLLNIYVPEGVLNNPEKKLPVIFWIHGGGLTEGSGNFEDYGPKYLVEKDVVYVSINYRLGPLGFLSMGNEDVPGNAGFRDQSLALKWVHDNIANFGGDPDSITIAGESAGALSVALHMTAPQSQKNFQRAIMQSDTAVGSAYTPISSEHAVEYAGLLARRLGCDEENNPLDCMQRRTIEEIFDNQDVMNGGVVWQATPDYKFTSDPFIPGEVEELLANGQFNQDIQIMAGSNNDEGILYFPEALADASQWDNVKTAFKTLGPRLLFNIADPADFTDEDFAKARQIIEFYVGSIDNINEEHKQGMIYMMTDASFLFGIHNGIRYWQKYGVTVFQYLLTYQGEYSLSNAFGLPTIGVCHGDDLKYLYDPVAYVAGELNEEDEFVRNLMTTAWTNFAKYGDPTPPDSEFEWTPQSDGSEHHFFNISGPSSAMASSQFIQDRMTLWDRVLEKN